MFNVTKINGVLSDVLTGKVVANFTRRMYGDSLGPREQRSFRYSFVPSKKLLPGEYGMTFSAHYSNRDKEPFATLVYNETKLLVAGPPEPSDLPLLQGAIVAALLLAAAAMCTQIAPAKALQPAVDYTRAADEPSQWLPKNVDTLPRKKKTAAKKA